MYSGSGHNTCMDEISQLLLISINNFFCYKTAWCNTLNIFASEYQSKGGDSSSLPVISKDKHDIFSEV